MFDLQPCAPEEVLGTSDLRLCLLGKPQEEDRVLPPHGFCLAACREALERVFANSLQHQQAWLAIGLRLLPQQALVHQGRHGLQHVDQEVCMSSADGFGCLERAASDKDREPSEQRLFVLA